MAISFLSALPTIYLCTFRLHLGVIDQVGRYKKCFLWNKGDMDKKRRMSCGMGSGLQAKGTRWLGYYLSQSSALLMKCLHKFYNHDDIPQVSLTWRYFYATDIVPHMKRPVGSFGEMSSQKWINMQGLLIVRSTLETQLAFGLITEIQGICRSCFPSYFPLSETRKLQLGNFYHKMPMQISSLLCLTKLWSNYQCRQSLFKLYRFRRMLLINGVSSGLLQNIAPKTFISS